MLSGATSSEASSPINKLMSQAQWKVVLAIPTVVTGEPEGILLAKTYPKWSKWLPSDPLARLHIAAGGILDKD